MLTSLGLIVGGVAILLVGVYFWGHPEHYYKYLHGVSIWADLNRRPPEFSVKLGAGLSVIIGIVMVGWGLGLLVS